MRLTRAFVSVTATLAHPESTLDLSRIASVMAAERLGIGIVDGMLRVGDLENRDYLVLGPPR